MTETREINQVVPTDLTYNKEGNYSFVDFKTSITKTPALSLIDFPDGHQVSFDYPSDRLDLNGDKKLSAINVKYQSRFLSRYQLNSTYLIKNRYGNPQTLYQGKVARLYLKSVTKYGVDLKESSNHYIFDYYLGSNGL